MEKLQIYVRIPGIFLESTLCNIAYRKKKHILVFGIHLM